ncbi:ATP-binding protein [Oscillatoria sp. CS-180]|uniref:ATP-binding protein n=1 Tax=Oscillatoria sp. CS-180 TaxID=3021720 RepID=UPI00232F5EFA|nr:ATP-binding protein [Oscillatoria sp. CS-180]MDB9528059.1 ATP-binding protein [Oscillatoria sp. CS-180]
MSSADETPELELAEQIAKLERQNRILQKKLTRSERTRAELETASQRREAMLKQVIQEAEDAKIELKKAIKLADSANEAKSEFLANMSHELRTPLNGILGYAQILSRTESISDKGQKGLDVIYQCGNHLLTLINDVLDLSKIEAHKMELYPTTLHLPSFIQSLVEICRVRAEQKNLIFNCSADEALPCGAIADEKRLRQVLLNLIGNAIKFTDDGQVDFRIRLIASDTDANLHRLRFEVQDTGVGMTPAQIEKIWLPFEQVGDSDRKQGGTGLGLSISNRIVEMMGSKLQVESQRGVGSVFSFEVELSETEDWDIPPVNTSGSQVVGYEGSKQTVLIIDDRWENRSVIANLLEPVGFEILEAPDGKQGLEQIGLNYPDIVITDLLMPIMDGYELLASLRSDPSLKAIPVIVSSASVFEVDKHKSIAAGASAFLPKPVQTTELLNLLEAHLKLNWIYQARARSQESGTVSQPNVYIRPPAEILIELNALIRKGDLDTLIQVVQKLDSQYSDFANAVISMAESFQVKQLKALIEKET